MRSLEKEIKQAIAHEGRVVSGKYCSDDLTVFCALGCHQKQLHPEWFKGIVADSQQPSDFEFYFTDELALDYPEYGEFVNGFDGMSEMDFSGRLAWHDKLEWKKEAVSAYRTGQRIREWAIKEGYLKA